MSKVEQENIKYLNFTYERETSDTKGAKRGTVKFKETIVPPYPSIKRAFSLKKGLENEFGTNEFVMEEKVDGNNMRLIYWKEEKKVLAFTRGGYFCPYTTEILEENENIREMFEDFPYLMVCGELIGPNPYNHVSAIYEKMPKVLVFDIFKTNVDREINLLLPLQRNELLSKYSIDTVKSFGTKTVADYEDIKEIIKKLEQEKREGVVFKSLEGLEPRVKYITLTGNIIAIAEHIAKGYETHAPGTKNRFYLLACYLTEIDDTNIEQVYSEFGKEILNNLISALKLRETIEKYVITVSREGWYLLKKRMLKHVQIRSTILETHSNGQITIEFVKIFPQSTTQINSLLSGRTFYD